MKILPVMSSNLYTPQKIEKHKNNTSAVSYASVSADAVRAKFCPSFSSLARFDNKTGHPLHSGFYRDFPTLIASAGFLKKNFPHGTTVLVGACSTGEDLISLYSLLPDAEKYKLIGFDKSDDALEIANKNIYSVIEDYGDAFLIDKTEDSTLRKLKSLFNNVMEKTSEPDFQLNAPNLMFINEPEMVYYRMKNEHRKNIDFKKLDINDIDSFLPEEEVGAIFFRNVFYMLTGNHLSMGIHNPENGHNIYVNKAECLNSIVDKVYERLPVGGFFIVGEVPAEHVYLADKYTPKNNRVIIDKVPMFNYDIDYNMADPEVEIYKKSPLHQALRKDNRFCPVFYTATRWNNYTFDVPTIWKKVN